jgi:hypothetical protein
VTGIDIELDIPTSSSNVCATGVWALRWVRDGEGVNSRTSPDEMILVWILAFTD